MRKRPIIPNGRGASSARRFRPAVVTARDCRHRLSSQGAILRHVTSLPEALRTLKRQTWMPSVLINDANAIDE
jgi:hypothetical protein